MCTHIVQINVIQQGGYQPEDNNIPRPSASVKRHHEYAKSNDQTGAEVYKMIHRRIT